MTRDSGSASVHRGRIGKDFPSSGPSLQENPGRRKIGGEGWQYGGSQTNHTTHGGSAARDAHGAGGTATILALLAAPALAEEVVAPSNAVSSTGGVATATGEASVVTGDIVTGFNTGHSVETGGATNGDVIVSVDEMGSAADLAVIAEVGSQIADASGGDGGEATTPSPSRRRTSTSTSTTPTRTATTTAATPPASARAARAAKAATAATSSSGDEPVE